MKELKDYEYFRTNLGVQYCGDNREILPLLERVDLLFTDPPFNVNYDYNQDFKDDLSLDEYKKFIFEVFSKVKTTRAVVKIPTKHAGWMYSTFDACFKYLWTLIEFKPNGMGHGSLGPHLYTLFLVNSRPVNKGIKDIFVNTVVDHGMLHPAQMPVLPVQRIIEWFSNPGDTVLDCFCGSGTTAIACEKLGDRKWVGIEVSKEYNEVIKTRVMVESRQLKFYG